MVAAPCLVLFCGGMGGSPAEDALSEALCACALDTLEEALATGAYEGAIVVADAKAAAQLGGRLPAGARLDRDRPDEPFHLGRRLSEVVTRHELERPVYVGWGLPLIKGDELAAVATALASSDLAVVSNNYYSADLVGFVPGRVVRDLELPDNDRVLPRLLSQEGGLVNLSLPRTMANQFDIDTPGDLAVLAYAGGAGRHLQAHLDAQPPDTRRLASAARIFTDSQAEVLVAGRIGPQVWQFLSTETASRVRVYSEERGLQAMGRDLNGEARSLLAFHLEAVGPVRFFAALAEMAHAAFIDTRPILAHLGLSPSRPDRFLSDLLQPDGIADAWLREFTAAARDASIPIVLGGNALVAAGVQLLSEAAWKEHDQIKTQYRAVGRARRSL